MHGSCFSYEALTDCYENEEEAIPPKAPLPKGKEMEPCMYLDSHHVGDTDTQD